MRRHRKQPLRELLPVTRRSKNLELPGLPEVRKLLNLFPIPGKFRNLIRLYTFHTLDDVIAAAHGLDGFYKGVNTLYKDENSLYQLIVHQSSCTAEEFNKVCNILSEYGSGRAFNAAGEAHLKEHGELISRKALQQLAKI